MTKTIRVWAIYYKVRCNSDDSWKKNNWTGPCGVYMRGLTDDSFLLNCLSRRPFFFRTRALARQKAKEMSTKSNLTWVWCKHTVRPFILTWDLAKETKNDKTTNRNTKICT